MRTRQEQTDDNLLQRARIRADWTYDDLGERLGRAGATAERYCLEDGNPRAILWMGADAAKRLKDLNLRTPDGVQITVENFRERAVPAAARKPRRRQRQSQGRG